MNWESYLQNINWEVDTSDGLAQFVFVGFEDLIEGGVEVLQLPDLKPYFIKIWQALYDIPNLGSHENSYAQVITVLSGNGRLVKSGVVIPLLTGVGVKIMPNEPHAVELQKGYTDLTIYYRQEGGDL